MCRECLIEVRPERERCCMQDGSYLLNFKGCAQCKVRGFITISDRHTEEDQDGADWEETITFNHKCASCQHVICEHWYSFRVAEGSVQEYMMDCFLCGRGADSVDLKKVTKKGIDEAQLRSVLCVDSDTNTEEQEEKKAPAPATETPSRISLEENAPTTAASSVSLSSLIAQRLSLHLVDKGDAAHPSTSTSTSEDWEE